jgi:hypothetical protein
LSASQGCLTHHAYLRLYGSQFTVSSKYPTAKDDFEGGYVQKSYQYLRGVRSNAVSTEEREYDRKF